MKYYKSYFEYNIVVVIIAIVASLFLTGYYFVWPNPTMISVEVTWYWLFGHFLSIVFTSSGSVVIWAWIGIYFINEYISERKVKRITPIETIEQVKKERNDIKRQLTIAGIQFKKQMERTMQLEAIIRLFQRETDEKCLKKVNSLVDVDSFIEN